VTVPIAAPEISEAAQEAVTDVLDSGMIADGEHVRQFESAFADYVGTDHAIATSSGTTALHAMLEAAGIGEDDVVVTSPFSFVSSANAIKHAGAEPVFVDVDPETFNLDPAATREILEQREDITAIMPVHLYGLPAEMDTFRELAAEFDLKLFEDAAQAHGASFNGEMVGELGDAAAFSFYPSKNMTTGEGGMITTDDDETADRARQVINHGRSDAYEHEFVGYNYRITNIQAVIGKDQLNRLPGWVERRRENARQLTDQLKTIDDIRTPTIPADRTHAFHQYTIVTDDRAAVESRLEAADVGYGIYYPITIPDQPAYDCEATIPVARRLADSVLSIPVHPQVDDDDIETVAGAVSTDLGVEQ
jgi:dTDP-4-amino-4,6-dideoxygalactose transaminase